MPDPPMMPSTALVMGTPDQLVAADVRLYCDAIIKHSPQGTRDLEMPATDDRDKRQSIIDACRSMNTLGINQGTSGNISLRHDDGMLITPTSTPYEAMRIERAVQIHENDLFGAHRLIGCTRRRDEHPVVMAQADVSGCALIDTQLVHAQTGIDDGLTLGPVIGCRHQLSLSNMRVSAPWRRNAIKLEASA